MKEITINNKHGVLTVSSLQVAEDFDKQHKHVLEKISDIMAQITSAENLADVPSEFSALRSMFIENTYEDSYGRLQKCYDITRDGFSLLVMGFTGKKALEWKIKYTDTMLSVYAQKIKEII